MSQPSGLSRRRVTTATGEEAPSSSTSSSGWDSPGGGSKDGGGGSSNGGPSTPPQGPSRSGTSYVDGGHKVAYDPREFEERGGEDRLNPGLTIMEEVLLLGLKDRAGYLSFWNDNISYALRGCILLELALRHRIAVVRDPNRRRWQPSERLVEVMDERLTGEVLLDEALKMMKVSEKMSIGTWIDLMSGETWNVMKIGYQLKQVRERLLKGLVDKGVLRTEKRNFLLFDMATHPVSDPVFKEQVVRRVWTLLLPQTITVNSEELYAGEGGGPLSGSGGGGRDTPPPADQAGGASSSGRIRYPVIRSVSMTCASYAANVVENCLGGGNGSQIGSGIGYEQREAALTKCDELIQEFGYWPFGRVSGTMNGSGPGSAVGSGGGPDPSGQSLAEILRLARQEVGDAEGKELHLEVVSGVLQVFGKMDSLL